MAARRSGKTPPWLLSTFGVIVLAAGLYLGVDNARFLSSAERAQGQVVDIRRIHAGYGRARRKPTEFPVLRFQDASGTTREVTGESDGGWPGWRVGQRVEIGYPAGRPRQARILAFSSLWLGPVLLVAGGVALLAWARARANARA